MMRQASPCATLAQFSVFLTNVLSSCSTIPRDMLLGTSEAPQRVCEAFDGPDSRSSGSEISSTARSRKTLLAVNPLMGC